MLVLIVLLFVVVGIGVGIGIDCEGVGCLVIGVNVFLEGMIGGWLNLFDVFVVLWVLFVFLGLFVWFVGVGEMVIL